MRRSLTLIIAVAVLMDVAPALQAAETVWSGLVMAENVPQQQPIPPELIRIEGLLKRFFGYNQFQVIGHSQKVLKTGQEDWLATSKFFGLHVDARGERQGGYVLNLKLYKEKELLLETEAKLSKRSPLVIKGPQVGGGQLLLVLVVQSVVRRDYRARRWRTARQAIFTILKRKKSEPFFNPTHAHSTCRISGFAFD